MIVCPNTSPLIVLARLKQLDLLGDPGDIRLTRAVRDEIRDKQDEVATLADEELDSVTLGSVGLSA